MIVSFQSNSDYLICHKKSRLLRTLLFKYDKRWLYTLPRVSYSLIHNSTHARHFCGLQMILVQWLVASFFAGDYLQHWHSLHGKPALLKQQPHASQLSMSQQVLIYTTLYIKSTEKIVFFLVQCRTNLTGT